MKKVLLITNLITPYRVPLFNYIYENTDFNFKILALAENEKNREWKIKKNKIRFNYAILKGWHGFISGKDLPIHINPGIFKALYDYKPDVVITSGYEAPAYWLAFLYCKIFKKRYILWNGSTLLSSTQTKGLISGIKRALIRSTDSCIAYGTKAEEYLMFFGAKKDKISIALNTVDMEFFRKHSSEYRGKEAFVKERSELPKLLLLYVGQLIERKGVLQVLKALEIFSDPGVGLFIVGDGPQKAMLEEYCREKGLNNVYFEGFKSEEELPKYYALSDVLILPSFREVWGLVINEAMASGLYVLASKYAGANFDLIKKGWNGDVFDPHSVEDICNIVKATKENIESIRMRRNEISASGCQKFSISKAGDTFLKALESWGVNR